MSLDLPYKTAEEREEFDDDLDEVEEDSFDEFEEDY